MFPALLVAAAEHGPGRHGGIAALVVAIAVVGGVVFLVQRGRK